MKAKSKPEAQSSRHSQPISAPYISQPPAPSLLPTSSPPAQTNAVSRARKRLRGEPVSPSPNKDKRRRVGSQSTLSFPSLLLEASSSDDDDGEINLSFVTDSPMKAPAAGSKSFKLLFDDSKTRPRQTKDAALAPTKSASQSLFGGRSSSMHSDELEWGLNENTGTRVNGIITTNGKRTTKHIRNHPTAQAQTSTKRTAPTTTPSEMRTSAKRSQPDTDTEYEVDISHEPPAKVPSLLPPSPPGPDSVAYHIKQGNKRPRANTNTRKKPKMADEHDEDEEDEEDEFNDSKTSVKIVNRTQPRNERGLNAAGGEDDLDYDSDPILGRAPPRGYVSSQVVEPDAKEDGKFEVDLPDKLRQVLALDSSKARDSQTESVVKGLLYGRRAGNYDPVKGGEIWDVGEDDGRRDGEEDVQRDTEGEDDWEGEPIPWEVGEL